MSETKHDISNVVSAGEKKSRKNRMHSQVRVFVGLSARLPWRMGRAKIIMRGWKGRGKKRNACKETLGSLSNRLVSPVSHKRGRR